MQGLNNLAVSNPRVRRSVTSSPVQAPAAAQAHAPDSLICAPRSLQIPTRLIAPQDGDPNQTLQSTAHQAVGLGHRALKVGGSVLRAGEGAEGGGRLRRATVRIRCSAGVQQHVRGADKR